MEELEKRFGAHLCLSEKERTGLVLEEEDIGDLWKGSQFTLVARVVTHKSVNREAFGGVFTRLWSGNDGVSIKEIGERRFLVRFANQYDKRRVLDMEPWTFRDGLVLLTEVHAGVDARMVQVDMGVFWVQLHGIPPLNMTMMVGKKVGALIGRVLEVDQANGTDCIGRFLRVRIKFDVGQPLMRGTFVAFPGDGSRWIDFKYEFLPEYCLACGCLGHPSRICLEQHKEESCNTGERAEALLAFAGLDAVEDIRGRRLKGSMRSRSGSRADKQGTWRSEKGHGAELDDTATSPSKSGSRPSTVAERIRSQREGEERNRQLREAAWEAGMVLRRGNSRDEDYSPNSVSTTLGVGLDLNIALGEQGVAGEGGENGSLTQNSDPFNLGPLIANAQRTGERMAKRKSVLNMGGQEDEDCSFGKRQRQGGADEARRCLLFADDLDQAVETSLNESPRTDPGVRRSQLGVLQERFNTWQEGGLVMGDFNDILDASEKVGGRPRLMQSMDDFRRFVTDSNLLDLGYEGYPFTWRNRREDGGIQERLDRGFANDQWLRLYPEARVVHQVVEGSDHVMVWLHTSPTQPRRACRFIFDPRWSTMERCHEIVKERWRKGFCGSKGLQVFEKLKWVRKGLVDWKRQEWRNSKVCIDSLRTELHTELQARDFDCSKDTGGLWHGEATDIRRIAESYFQDLFSSGNPRGMDEILGCVRATVTPQDNMSLGKAIQEDEVLAAVKQLDPIKSPGPDGFTGNFYQKFWPTIG
ncbi:unnamed protein product, partial [Prunus brigantina]